MKNSSDAIEGGSSEGLTVTDLPVGAYFEGGGNVYWKLTADKALQVKFDPKDGHTIGYGQTIDLSEFPDVRFHSMNPEKSRALRQQHPVPSLVGECCSYLCSGIRSLFSRRATKRS